MDGTGELFYRQVPLLARAHRVVTYALRDNAASMEVLAGDLARIIEAVSPRERRAIILGESFGGAVALSTALAHPEHVSELVILNSFPYFRPQIRLRIAIAGLRAMPWGAMNGYLTRLSLLTRYDVRERLGEIRCPVLFLAAEKDHLVPSMEQAHYMVARIPSATLRVLPGHGHICLIAPDIDLAQILEEWRAARLPPQIP
jgi:pimeloyl-ACP methyl ester carboxylesterase